MKKNAMTLLSVIMLLTTLSLSAQNDAQSPEMFGTAIAHKVIVPMSDFSALTAEELAEMAVEEATIKRNQDLKVRNYPFYEQYKNDGPGPGLQKEMGTRGSKGIIQNWSGQSSFSNPPDDNGAAGPNHYMQTINVKYTIYDKSGTLLEGPTNLNAFFSGLPGGNNNDGDPIVLYDEQAQRWLMAEFSGAWSNPDYMLIAISQTSDPTGMWDAWSFMMNGFPDYMKFGVWRDGYYMGTNTYSGNDIYVFERDEMLAGGSSPQMVQFNNPNRPNSGFHCVLPVDNDGTFAPEGSPGMFMTINDNAWGGSTSDQLWLFELDVDWTTPSNSTFSRVQQIDVASFDSNFGSSWENIRQPGTGQKLDGISQILMHRVQYRNFGSSQNIVCNHTVDVGGDQAGVRWYELQYNGSEWEVRQYGTYAPDNDNRWMGSIAMNGSREIALGYSVSSSTTYPSIRYTGQSSEENALASGTLDIIETSIQEGTASQTSSERWGDYSNLSIDPSDNHTFWFTTQYNISNSQKGTKICSFEFPLATLLADFEADNTTPTTADDVHFTDLSAGNPSTWSWEFTPNTVSYMDGTSSTSQNPVVRFNSSGLYTVELTASNFGGSNTMTKTDYIDASAAQLAPIADFEADITAPELTETVNFYDLSIYEPSSWLWSFTPNTITYMSGTNSTSQNPAVRFDVTGYYTVSLTATNGIGSDDEIKIDYIHATEITLAPVADFEADNTSPELTEQVNFTDLSINDPTSWLWTIAPNTITYLAGTNSASQNPAVRFDAAGYYTVSLTSTNSAGSDEETKVEYINAWEGLSTAATVSPNQICQGEWTQLNATPSGGSGTYTYSWTSDPVGFTSGIQNPIAYPEESTTYYVEVNDGTNTALADVSVTVDPLPMITLGEWPDNLCNVDVSPVQLMATPGGGTYDGPGVSLSGLFISSLADIGWNVITYSYESGNGCSNSAQDSIYVDDCFGVNEIRSDEEVVNIYPNPSMGSFTLESEKNIEKIEIIDQSGKMVLMRKINDKKTPISAYRNSGLYFIRVYLESQSNSPKVVTKELIIK